MPTTNFAWPFPSGADPANVPVDLAALANAADATVGNAWTSYSPAWTSSGVAPVLGTGTLVGQFKSLGHTGIARITLVAGGTTTFGTGTYAWSLPVGWSLTAITGGGQLGSALCFDASATTAFVGAVQNTVTTTVEIRTHSATALVGATVPFTFATGDIVRIMIVVPLT